MCACVCVCVRGEEFHSSHPLGKGTRTRTIAAFHQRHPADKSKRQPRIRSKPAQGHIHNLRAIINEQLQPGNGIAEAKREEEGVDIHWPSPKLSFN